MQSPSTSMASFQTVALQRKTAQKTYIARDVARSISDRLRVHGDTPGRVARSVGMTAPEVVSVLIGVMEGEIRAAHTRGVMEGRLCGAFPLRPIPPSERRAA